MDDGSKSFEQINIIKTDRSRSKVVKSEVVQLNLECDQGPRDSGTVSYDLIDSENDAGGMITSQKLLSPDIINALR